VHVTQKGGDPMRLLLAALAVLFLLAGLYVVR
jgi:hypothetical protein